MTEHKMIREFSHADLTVEFDLSKFSDSKEKRPETGLKDKKYNVKIKKGDLYLLDALASKEGISRSALINSLIYQILLEELESIPELDVRLLLATAADRKYDHEPEAKPWVHDVFNTLISKAQKEIISYGERSFSYDFYGAGSIMMETGDKQTYEEYLNTKSMEKRMSFTHSEVFIAMAKKIHPDAFEDHHE